MEVSTRKEERFCVIRVDAPRIDAAGALAFKDAMRRETREAPQTVVLDLSAVTFIDSSGLGAIVATMKLLAPERKLVLAGPTPAVERVFRLTRMHTVFDLHPTLAAALESLDTAAAARG